MNEGEIIEKKDWCRLEEGQTKEERRKAVKEQGKKRRREQQRPVNTPICSCFAFILFTLAFFLHPFAFQQERS